MVKARQTEVTLHLDVLEPLFLVREIGVSGGAAVLGDLLLAVVVKRNTGDVVHRCMVRLALGMSGAHVGRVVGPSVRINGLVDEVLRKPWMSNANTCTSLSYSPAGALHPTGRA